MGEPVSCSASLLLQVVQSRALTVAVAWDISFLLPQVLLKSLVEAKALSAGARRPGSKTLKTLLFSRVSLGSWACFTFFMFVVSQS